MNENNKTKTLLLFMFAFYEFIFNWLYNTSNIHVHTSHDIVKKKKCFFSCSYFKKKTNIQRQWKLRRVRYFIKIKAEILVSSRHYRWKINIKTTIYISSIHFFGEHSNCRQLWQVDMLLYSTLKCVSHHPRSPTESSPSKEALIRRQGQWPFMNATTTSPLSATISSPVLLDPRGTRLRLLVIVCNFYIPNNSSSYNWDSCCFPLSP